MEEEGEIHLLPLSDAKIFFFRSSKSLAGGRRRHLVNTGCFGQGGFFKSLDWYWRLLRFVTLMVTIVMVVALLQMEEDLRKPNQQRTLNKVLTELRCRDFC